MPAQACEAVQDTPESGKAAVNSFIQAERPLMLLPHGALHRKKVAVLCGDLPQGPTGHWAAQTTAPFSDELMTAYASATPQHTVRNCRVQAAEGRAGPSRAQVWLTQCCAPVGAEAEKAGRQRLLAIGPAGSQCEFADGTPSRLHGRVQESVRFCIIIIRRRLTRTGKSSRQQTLIPLGKVSQGDRVASLRRACCLQVSASVAQDRIARRL